jgi:hypothetical protein
MSWLRLISPGDRLGLATLLRFYSTQRGSRESTLKKDNLGSRWGVRTGEKNQQRRGRKLSIYDDPELSSSVITFVNPGDHVRGKMISVDAIKTQFGKVAQFRLMDMDTSTERTMLAGAADLWRQLSSLRPEPGDMIEITLLTAPERGAKLYKVTVDHDVDPFKE